ncbi:MAG: anthranilate synthase component I, partial [Streptosporangiaceae bacterium]
MDETSYLTAGGVLVRRVAEEFDAGQLGDITRQVELRPGGVLSSGMEYPGRYSRWHLAYVDPPAGLIARGRTITARALNQRGLVLLPVLAAALGRVGEVVTGERHAEVTVAESDEVFTEEQRSRQPTVFSALREIIAAFR